MNKWLSKKTIFLVIPSFLAIFILTQISSYFIIFSKFAPHDDEGFLLISIKEFISGNPLYDSTFTQYGPFYYFIQQILYDILKIPLNHNHTRLVTIGLWAISTTLITIYSYKMTKSYCLAFLTYIVTWNHLQVLGQEPSHPQELTVTLTSLILLLALIKNENWRNIAIAIIATALLFTKINLGIFLFAAIFVVIYSLPAKTKFLSISKKLLYLSICLLPVILMRQKLNDSLIQNFCFIITLGLAPILHYLYYKPIQWSNRSTISHLIYLTATSILSALLILAYVILNGSTLKALFNGVIVQPMKFPEAFSMLLNSQPASILVAGLGIILYSYYIKSSETEKYPKWIYYAKTLLAILLFIWSFFNLTGVFYQNQIEKILNYTPTFLWLTLITEKNEESEKTDQNVYFSRLLLAVVGYLQLLIVFPVAGSQRSIATLLLVPTIAINISDSLPTLRDDFLMLWQKKSFKLTTIIFLISIFLYITAQLPKITFPWTTYYSNVSINFSGADRIRLSEEQNAIYQWIIRNLSNNSDTFIASPGFPSFYFWAQKDTPSTITQNCWPAFLDANQQQQIIDKLYSYNSVCAIKNDYWRDFWLQNKLAIGQPLVDYIDNEFKVLGQLENYQFCVKKERQVELTFTAKVQQNIEPSAKNKYLVKIFLNLPNLNKMLYNVVFVDLRGNKVFFDTRKDSVILEAEEKNLLFPNQSFSGLLLDKPIKLQLQTTLPQSLYNSFFVVRLLDKDGNNFASIPVEK